MDRFRDLERAGKSARIDASFLAAIAGFEALRHPTALDHRQFSNLFLGLFPHTQDQTKRTAAAALSRLTVLPESVAVTIANQPVSIAAPFLAFSNCANDRILLEVIGRHGVTHGRAISRRKALSKPVVSALVALDDIAVIRSLMVRGSLAMDGTVESGTQPDLRMQNEEALRIRLKDMAVQKRSSNMETGNAGNKDTLGKLLVMQARGPNALRFADCLALALRSNTSLTDRIMLDLSGHQLATALQALCVGDKHAQAVLEGVFPQLTREVNGVPHSKRLLDACDREESIKKVDAWRRANEKTVDRKPVLQPQTVDTPTRVAKLPSDRRIKIADRRDRGVTYPARRA